MTKLTEWLFVITLFLAVWLGVLFGYTPIRLNDQTKIWIYLLPIFLVALFGVVSLIIIVYRVATFNNCDEAYRELVKEIEDAKKDLTAKGFKFRD